MAFTKAYWIILFPCLVTSLITAVFCTRLLLLSDAIKIIGSTIFGMAVSSLIAIIQSFNKGKQDDLLKKWAFSGLIGAITGLISSSYSILGIVNSQGKSTFLVFLIVCSFEAMGGAIAFTVSKIISEKINKQPIFIEVILFQVAMGSGTALFGSLYTLSTRYIFLTFTSNPQVVI